MDSPKSPSGSVRRHVRNISHPLPRRNTKGPLDAVDDPLADRPTSIRSDSTTEAVPGDVEVATSAPAKPLPLPPNRKFDLRFLQSPQTYHQLPTDDIPAAFLKSEHQPSPDATLPDLLAKGHFRPAAVVALRQLLQADSNDVEHILPLLYTRLACLVLISKPDLAAEEALPLTDFLGRGTPSAKDLLPDVPWGLRILLVRLQAIVADDGGRRAIMALYALAAEVRSHLRDASKSGDVQMAQTWSSRLTDLGLRVADAFVEMCELETAIRHLDSLLDVDTDEVNFRKALLRVRLGDSDGAQRSINGITSEERREMINALLTIANDDWRDAVDAWKSAGKKYSASDFLQQNAAVCLMYTGRLAESRDISERLAEEHDAYPALLFNLSTVYELCTERAVDRKASLATSLAAKPATPSSGGWERSNAYFKL
nr:hypothetical protein B0A51_07230 [Rachicladosporium sp. CCFEE 5018]OQO23569.1 hypothetical protein B0A51_07466 [Rachicladosporium sp. CCFEE 5018]